MIAIRASAIAVVAALLLLPLAGGALGDALPKAASPEEVGLSAERLGRITSVLKVHVDEGRLPGASALVARHGKIAYFETFGFRDRAAGVPMTKESMFRIYSMTKPITAVAALMLQEEGKLQISDPVLKFIEPFKSLKVGIEKTDPATGKIALERVDPNRPMTVQDLMRHTAGLTYGARGNAYEAVKELYREAKIGSRDDTNADLVGKLANIPLTFHPGTRWEYGVSTDVLGRVVEAVSGQTLGQFFETRIFKPLGMNDTAFHVPTDKLGRAAQPWSRPGGPEQTPRFDVAVPAKYESGGGGLVSTMSDYLRFAQMLLNGGELNGKRLLGAMTVDYMAADHLGDIPGFGRPGLGFGLAVQMRKAEGMAGLPGSAGDYGWAGAAGTLFWVDPKERLIGLYMIQVSADERVYFRDQFKTLVAQTIVKRTNGAAATH